MSKKYKIILVDLFLDIKRFSSANKRLIKNEKKGLTLLYPSQNIFDKINMKDIS